MIKFSRAGQKKFETCHPDIISVIQDVQNISGIDFGVACGERTVEEQNSLYKRGLSKIDGYSRKGKHNYNPSKAIDIYAYYNGKAQYDTPTMSFLAGMIMGTASRLLKMGAITHRFRWGGNWDMDGVIMKDQTFQDLCHFEIVD